MKKILLIEDDTFIRDLTAARMIQNSFEVLSAATGEEAFTIMESVTPDILLVDLDLPDVYGLDILKQMNAIERLSNVPAIVFTNNDSPEVISKVKQSGAYDFFNKSQTDFTLLVQVINAALAREDVDNA